MLTRTLAAALGLFLAGCAAQKPYDPVSDSHPANPSAAAAPLPPRSPTLALATADLPAPTAPAADPHAVHHAGGGTSASPDAGSPSADPHAAHRGHGSAGGAAHAESDPNAADRHAAHRGHGAAGAAPDPADAAATDPHAAHGGDHAQHGGAPATAPPAGPAATAAYVCPMHPEVTSPGPARCPKCEMKLERNAKAAPAGSARNDHAADGRGDHATRAPAGASARPPAAAAADPAAFVCPMHPEVTSPAAARCPKCEMKLVKNEKASAAPAPHAGHAADAGAADAGAADARAADVHAAEAHAGQAGPVPARPSTRPSAATTADPAAYVCPMHPEVTSPGPARCPECEMKLVKKKTAPAPAPAGPHDHAGHRAPASSPPADGGHDHGGHR